MTVGSARKPTLPLVRTLASDSHPAPDAARANVGEAREVRGLPASWVGNHLPVLRLLVSTSVPDKCLNVKRFGLGREFPAQAPNKGTAFHPRLKRAGLSSPTCC